MDPCATDPCLLFQACRILGFYWFIHLSPGWNGKTIRFNWTSLSACWYHSGSTGAFWSKHSREISSGTSLSSRTSLFLHRISLCTARSCPRQIGSASSYIWAMRVTTGSVRNTEPAWSPSFAGGWVDLILNGWNQVSQLTSGIAHDWYLLTNEATVNKQRKCYWRQKSTRLDFMGH